MDIQDLLNEIANKLPRIREIIYQIRFEKIKMDDDCQYYNADFVGVRPIIEITYDDV